MVSAIEHIGFKSMSDRNNDELTKRMMIREGVIRFRNPFLKATLGGITKNDTILLGAETGCGKTQLASEIAEDAAASGKRVFIFALEADTNEWERRRKYSVLSEIFIKSGGDRSILDYQDWMQGDLPELDFFEQEASDIINNSQVFKNIFTFYKDASFGIQDFVKKFAVIENQADLVIVDHIHYFDLFSDKHNEELSQIMHKMRSLTQTLNIPVLLIAHLRKRANGQEKKLIPDIADFHGSSELSKVCTRAIMLSPGSWNSDFKGYNTFIKVVKNRWGRGRTDVVGKIIFDPSLDRYNQELVAFGKDDGGNSFSEFTALDPRPNWLAKVIG